MTLNEVTTACSNLSFHSGHWFKKINSTYGSHLIFTIDTVTYETLEILSYNVASPRIHKVLFPFYPHKKEILPVATSYLHNHSSLGIH